MDSLGNKIVRGIISIFGIAIGLSIAQLIIDSSFINLPQGSPWGWILYVVLSIGFGIAAYFLAPQLMKLYKKATESIERIFLDMPLSDIFIGVIGLVFGLVIAYLISSFVMMIELRVLGVVISIAIFMILGYLGWSIPTKRSKEINLPGWFKRSEKVAKTIAMPKILDTSAIIDARFFDVHATGIIEGTIIIPQFVLTELRHIADSADPMKRARGRRGLDMLQKMQDSQSIAVYNTDYPEITEVDAKLLRFATDFHGMIVTTDYNLNKVASVQSVPVFNINDLANAIRTNLTTGQELTVSVIREGKEVLQGVSYLDDGTMIVIDGASPYVGQVIDIVVTSVLQTSAGRMVFAKLRV